MVQVAPRSLWCLALLLAACARETPLATLEGRALGERAFRQHLASRYPAEEQQSILAIPARRQAALNAWFDGLAMAAKARRLGIDREPRFRKAVELTEMRTLARLKTEQNRSRIEAIARVSQDEVQRFYDEHKGDYQRRPSFSARQVLVYVRGNPAFPERGLGEAEARAKAREALRQLRQGRNWDVVARRFSDDLSNNQHGGLIRDGQFGLFAPEVEQAVRTQALGKPGEVVKSLFGFHVLQVESRVLDGQTEPLSAVEPLIRERLAAAHAEHVHAIFVAPIAREMGLTIAEAGRRDVPLFDESAVAEGEILAEVAGKRIREADFRWFLKDALPAGHRSFVFSLSGARGKFLASFLDDLVLEAKARREGLDLDPEFIRQRTAIEQSLLVEFVQEHDKTGPFCQCQESPEEREAADRRYFDQVRAEVGLRVVQPALASALAKPSPNSQSRSPRID